MFTNTVSIQKLDFDAYGLKMAVNDILFVQIDEDGRTFLVQFAPYDYILDSLQCTLQNDDPTLYVYTVGVGQKHNEDDNPFFYFAGTVSNSDPSANNGTFIGIWINRNPRPLQHYLLSKQSFTCDYFMVDQLQFISGYRRQEFFVIAVEPFGQYAIGLATDFAFIYRPFSNVTTTTLPTANIWPKNTIFNPCAADATETFTIVAGFVKGPERSRIRATPTIYLLSNSNLTILSTWSYRASNNSWQAYLTFLGANIWNNEYTMSVKINSDDPTRILIGMPFINTVFLFIVDNNGTTLKLAKSFENGKSLGYGKSVAWLTSSQTAILLSTDAVNNQLWYSPKIYLYNLLNDTMIPSSPLAVIPNAQQPLPPTIDSKLIRMVSTPTALIVLDTNGGVLIILSAAPGNYASTDIANSPITASMPVVSHSVTCISGTYKPDSGVQPCKLCPSGSRNPGGIAGISCVPCSPDSFCPLGAVYETDLSLLTSVSQAYPYPRSPETTVFEDILLENMLSLYLTPHCLMVSPVFWILILALIIFLLLIGISTLRWCIPAQKHDLLRSTVKGVFQKADLLGEGKLWIGGIASLGIILMSIIAYIFSISYLYQYSAEQVGPSNFACDTSMRNAKFQSSLQAIAVPISDKEKPIFMLLSEQKLTLHIAFINTAASCESLTISTVIESATIPLPFISCYTSNGTMFGEVSLPEHDIQITATINNIQLVGAVRLGLSGCGSKNGLDQLKELNFRQSFFSQSGRTLSQVSNIDIILTKVINETQSLSNGGSQFEGIWYPTFHYIPGEMLIKESSYIMGASFASTIITIRISETAHYIKNVQSPIAKKPEVVFRTLLFCFSCLETCTLLAVVCKIFVAPVYQKIAARICRCSSKKITLEHEIKSRH